MKNVVQFIEKLVEIHDATVNQLLDLDPRYQREPSLRAYQLLQNQFLLVPVLQRRPEPHYRFPHPGSFLAAALAKILEREELLSLNVYAKGWNYFKVAPQSALTAYPEDKKDVLIHEFQTLCQQFLAKTMKEVATLTSYVESLHSKLTHVQIAVGIHYSDIVSPMLMLKGKQLTLKHDCNDKAMKQLGEVLEVNCRPLETMDGGFHYLMIYVESLPCPNLEIFLEQLQFCKILESEWLDSDLASKLVVYLKQNNNSHQAIIMTGNNFWPRFTVADVKDIADALEHNINVLSLGKFTEFLRNYHGGLDGKARGIYNEQAMRIDKYLKRNQQHRKAWTQVIPQLLAAKVTPFNSESSDRLKWNEGQARALTPSIMGFIGALEPTSKKESKDAANDKTKKEIDYRASEVLSGFASTRFYNNFHKEKAPQKNAIELQEPLAPTFSRTRAADN